MNRRLNRGLSLLEVVIGAAVILLTVSVTAWAFQAIVRSASLANRVVSAAFLLEEGVEVVKVIRGAGWNNLASLDADTPYTLVFDGNNWSTQTDRQLIDGLFDRTIVLGQVYRDNNQDIAQAGVLDPNTKRVSVSVAWHDRGATTTKTISTYVTNF